MATSLIQNGAICGALAAIMKDRSPNILSASGTPATYATLALSAKAIGTAVVTANAALVTPMADADNASIATLLAAATDAIISGRSDISTTASDYAAEAALIVAMAKQTIAKLV